MADEMSMNIGGITFQKDQVKRQTSEQKTRVDDYGIVSAFTEYQVVLKDGTKLTYETQNSNRKATVVMNAINTKNKEVAPSYSMHMYGLENVKIKDTPNSDIYNLYGCMGLDIHTDTPQPQNATSPNTDYIKVNDRVLEDGTIQVSKNNTFYADRDFIRLQDDEGSRYIPRKTENKIYHQHDARKAKDIE